MNRPVISDSVLYIGCDDSDLDLFESQYVVPEGVSYNSYVILDEKVAVMDTADRRVGDMWLSNLEAALNGRKPDYLVIHHLEPDHAANIGRFAEKYPDAVLVGNAKTFLMLPSYYEDLDLTGRTLTVKEGDTLSLGRHSLTFVMAPMVHWPEVMVSFEASERILFSADAFGKFGTIASYDGDWACEARRYYMNIVGKYGAQVQALLKKAAALDIATICPLHGPVLTGDLSRYMELYDIWSSYRPEDRGVTVAAASIHGNTRGAARYLAELLEKKGEKVEFFDLTRCDIAEAVEAAFRYDRMVLAACTYDGGLFPAMEDFLAHLKAKNWQGRSVSLIENGSWAPQAGKLMRAALEGMKNITVSEDVITLRGAVKRADRAAIEALAEKL